MNMIESKVIKKTNKHPDLVSGVSTSVMLSSSLELD